MSTRARTAAAGIAMMSLLSGCILFPPYWFPTDPMTPGTEIVVANETDADWVLSLGDDVPAAFAIGAGEVGTVTPLGPEPSELVLLDPDCEEVDRLEWDGSAAGVLISERGKLSASDTPPAEAGATFVEYFDCMDGSFGAAPEPGDALPEAGGTILLTAGDGVVFVLDVSSATLTRFGEGSDDPFDVEHAWSPDGSRVAFSRLASSGEAGVFVAAADGSDAELLVEDGASPRWSPDGSLIAYLSTDPFAGSSALALIGVDARGLIELADDASQPAWSPDGERLAFITSFALDGSLEAEPGELRIVNVDGSGLETLAEASPFASAPAWSPDGSRLAFVAVPEGADPGAFDVESVIAIHDLASGETTTLAAVEGAGLAEPAWSPDGETIAFTLSSAGLFASSGALATVPAGGGEITRVVESASAYFSTPIWSPDGAWLAVTRSDNADFTSSLLAIRPDGRAETVLASGVSYATAWRSNPS